MGNIRSCCCREADNDEIDGRDERSRIIDNICDDTHANCDDDLYSRSSHTSAMSHSHSQNEHHHTPSYGSIQNGGNKVEQTALNRILQKMASNVIDVTPGESMLGRQGDFVERQRAYQLKLNQIKTPLVLKSTLLTLHRTGFNGGNGNQTLDTTTGIQQTTTSANKSMDSRRVNYEPIPDEEVQIMNILSQQSALAVRNGLRIDSDEQIVAQFNPD